MNQRGFTKILLIGIVVVLLGAAGYFALMRKPTPTVQQTLPQTSTQVPVTQQPAPQAQSSETINWKTYQNKTYGFEFIYPSAWSLEETSGNSLKTYNYHPNISLITTGYNVIRWYKSYQDVEKVTGFKYNSQLKKWGYLFYRDYYDPSAGPGDFRELNKIFTTEAGVPVYCLGHEGGADHLIPISDNTLVLMESIRCIRNSSYPAPEDKLYKVLQSFRLIL